MRIAALCRPIPARAHGEPSLRRRDSNPRLPGYGPGLEPLQSLRSDPPGVRTRILLLEGQVPLTTLPSGPRVLRAGLEPANSRLRAWRGYQFLQRSMNLRTPPRSRTSTVPGRNRMCFPLRKRRSKYPARVLTPVPSVKSRLHHRNACRAGNCLAFRLPVCSRRFSFLSADRGLNPETHGL
jgi:hypothetical protein